MQYGEGVDFWIFKIIRSQLSYAPHSIIESFRTKNVGRFKKIRQGLVQVQPKKKHRNKKFKFSIVQYTVVSHMLVTTVEHC